MGMVNLLKEFGALLWHHPLSACCFLVLFTPPFFPVLRFFSPLLISTALFMVAIVTIGPDLRETSVDDDDDYDDEAEKELIQDSQIAVVGDKLTLVVQRPNQFEENGCDETWLVTKAVVAGKESGKSRWRSLRRIYKEKGIDWIENLFRNEDWKGPGVGLNDDQNVLILQETFPPRDEEEANLLENTTTRSIKKSGDGGGALDFPEVPPPPPISDGEFPKEFAGLGGCPDSAPTAEKQSVFAAAEAPAILDQDALAITNFDMPALETGDEEDEDEQYGEGYQSGDGDNELGHCDPETASPVQTDLHQEFEAGGLEASIHAPTIQEHEIPAAAAAATSVLLEQRDAPVLVVGIHEEESSVTELEDSTVGEFNGERSLPATAICKERELLPLTQIPQEKSHPTVSESGEEQEEEMSHPVSSLVISKNNKETQLLLDRLEQLPSTTAHSPSVTKIHGDLSLVEEDRLSSARAESHKKLLTPRADTLQERSHSISGEASAASVAPHNCEEKLISAIDSEEETGPHNATISQLHLPVAETISVPATNNHNYHIPMAADAIDEIADDDDDDDDSTFNPSVVT